MLQKTVSVLVMLNTKVVWQRARTLAGLRLASWATCFARSHAACTHPACHHKAPHAHCNACGSCTGQLHQLTARSVGLQFYVDVGQEEHKLDVLCDLYETLAITQSVIFANTRRKARPCPLPGSFLLRFLLPAVLCHHLFVARP